MGFDDFNKDDIEEGPLPGFRFHPTDEELVGFYLRKKLDKKPIRFDLIKQIDIYKYEPWDLAKMCSTKGEKEWYFFCKRGRKYKNSIRPNRVTSSGFWKATGIDKPVYSHGGEGKDCIGLKKTLVYYRGSAGKGIKTDWMMHEFRLPSENDNNIVKNNAADIAPEAEIWTLCRILKRNVSQRKQFTTDMKQLAANKRISTAEKKISKMRSVDEAYNICFENNFGHINYNNDHNNKSVIIDNNNNNTKTKNDQLLTVAQQQSAQLLTAPPSSNLWISPIVNDLFSFENWDELASIVKVAFDSPSYDVNNPVFTF